MPSHKVDDGLKGGTQSSSIHNDIGRAWTMYNYNGRSQGPVNPPQGSTDITRAGRALESPLEAGQTIAVVIDNPTERAFWRGYNVKLNSGGANVCYAGATCTPGFSPVNRVGVGTFEYLSYGRWGGSTLYDTDTDSGVKIEFTLTDADSYRLTMTPLDNPGIAYEEEGDLEPGGPIDWIEFQFYNTDSDFYPTMIPLNPGNPALGPQPTDYYIRSIDVTAPDPAGVPGDYNDDGVVNAADYVIARKHLGAAFQLDNEVTGVTPGNVTDEDLAAWRERFGDPGAGAGSGPAAAPEPATFVYLVFAAAALMLWGVRRPTMHSEPCVIKPTGRPE
jgi:hypothetical protein